MLCSLLVFSSALCSFNLLFFGWFWRVLVADNPQENEKTCLISGKAGQVQEAKRLIEDLLQNSAQAKNGGGGGGGGRQKYECEEIYKVPASKTGVIIGKGTFCCRQSLKKSPVTRFLVAGGETIRQICERSGAKVELDRNHPQTAEDRIFHMRGSRSCVEAAKRFIEEKLADQAVRVRVCWWFFFTALIEFVFREEITATIVDQVEGKFRHTESQACSYSCFLMGKLLCESDVWLFFLFWIAVSLVIASASITSALSQQTFPLIECGSGEFALSSPLSNQSLHQSFAQFS